MNICVDAASTAESLSAQFLSLLHS
jgi:hypothetical protein